MASIFFEFELPNPTTWFYFSALLAVVLIDVDGTPCGKPSVRRATWRGGRRGRRRVPCRGR